MTANSEVDTNLSGAGSSAGVAASNTAATGAGAAEHRTSGTDAHTVHAADFDGNSVRSMDVDKDTGTDERFEVETADRSSVAWLNAKRTYDLHQTLDTEAILLARREQNIERERARLWDDRENQQRLRHMDEVHAQSLRHYEDMHTMRWNTGTGFWADTVQEAFAERVAGKVCAKMKAG